LDGWHNSRTSDGSSIDQGLDQTRSLVAQNHEALMRVDLIVAT